MVANGNNERIQKYKKHKKYTIQQARMCEFCVVFGVSHTPEKKTPTKQIIGVLP